MPIINQRAVILFHPNIESVATPLPDLLSRLNSYAVTMQQVTNSENYKLNLLIGISKSKFLGLNDTKYGALNIARVTNASIVPISFSIRIIFYILKRFRKEQHLTLIAGDLGASLIPLLLSKFVFRSRVKTQISIHGQFLKVGRGFDLKAFILNRILMLAIRKSDSIRVVSNHLAANIVELVPDFTGQIFISPVPVSLSLRTNSTLKLPTNTVAIVGRLHAERGIMEALNFMNEALRVNNDMKLVVAGMGSLELEIRKWIENSKLGDRIQFMGELTQVQTMELWGEVDILVSNAESEGYGMAIREAALHGCRVVARRNAGTESLAAQYGEAISLYDSAEQFLVCLESAYSLINLPIDSVRLRNIQELQDAEARTMLIDSWLTD